MDDARRWRAPSRARTAGLVLLLAVCAGSSSGCWGQSTFGAAGMTELQQHAAFFDGNHDGIITVEETSHGMQRIGFDAIAANDFATKANSALGPKTRPDNATSTITDIYIVNIHKGIHGSDTGAYDPQGRFVLEKLDEMFTKYGKTVPNAMNPNEIDAMLMANQEPNDVNGWRASKIEWKNLYNLAKDKDGLLHKDVARAIYNGSLFDQLARRKKA